MLVLGFRQGESVRIGDAVIRFVRLRDSSIRLGFEAPASVPIPRQNARKRLPLAEVRYLRDGDKD